MQAIFVTARLKSTRLPKKVLLNTMGQPLIYYHLERIKNLSSIPIVICTSTNKQDDEIYLFGQKNNFNVYRGSEEDVLERYLEAARHLGVTSAYITYADEPFIDADLMKLTLQQLDTQSPLWVKNDAYIDGVFGYGLNLSALELINRLKVSTCNEVWGLMVSRLPVDIKTNYPSYCKTQLGCRLTIDYPEDFEVFSRLIEVMQEDFKTLSVDEIIKLYQSLNLREINGFRSEEYNRRIISQNAESP